MKNKQESLVGAIEVEVVWTIKEKATKVVMAEVAIHVVITQTKLQIVILIASTQDNQEEVVTTVAKIQDQTIKAIKLNAVLKQFQIKGMVKIQSTEEWSIYTIENLELMIINIYINNKY